MKHLWKWLKRAIFLTVITVVFLGIIGVLILSRTLPPKDAQYNVSTLSQEAKIVFDKNGVPHIEANDVNDAMRALGFVQARDRLWQMEFLRRVGEGRLSEILGESTLKADIFLRTLNMKDAAKLSFEHLEPETQKVLTSYAEGINAYLDRKTRVFEAQFSPEFLILGHSPEAWEPWHSVLILKVMGLTLSSNLDDEIKRLALASEHFSSQMIDEIMPYSRRDKPVELPDLHKLYGFDRVPKSLSMTDETPSFALNSQSHQAKEFEWPIGQRASNNWVISGSRTQSGKPILANDPHLGLTAPSTFYLVHMSFPHEDKTKHLIGGMIPGIPFIMSGRNEAVAWGLTTTSLDSQDLFLEWLKPGNLNQYQTNFGWGEFERSTSIVKVKDGEDVHINRRVSRHGVVLPNDYKDLGNYLPENTVGALSWTGLASDDTTMDALYGFNLSNNIHENVPLLERVVSPMQSIVFADVEGNIGLFTPARVPIRKDSNKLMGRAPALGWQLKYQWEKQENASKLPAMINPQKGAFATANGNFLANNYPYHITYDWAEDYRQLQVEKLVFDAQEKHTIETSKNIIADDSSQALLDLIDVSAQVVKQGTGNEGDIMTALLEWDGHMRVDRPEPLIALAYYKHLHENLFKDDLGKIYPRFAKGRLSRIINILQGSTVRDWCDDVTTNIIENCETIIRASLKDAIDDLEKKLGGHWKTWRYGKTHVAHNKHRPFSEVGALAWLFDVKVSSKGGPFTLLRGQTDFSSQHPYEASHGAAYRAIYDFADLDKSLYINSTGQSGNFLSSHYDDLAEKWSQVEFLQMSTKKEDYEERGLGTWVLTPVMITRP